MVLKLDREMKRKLVKGLTEEVIEVYGVHHVSIVIHENESENAGLGANFLTFRGGR